MGMASPDTTLGQLAQAVVALKPELVTELARRAIEEKITPDTVMTEGLARGMKLVGEKFAAREYFVPEVLLAARAMYAGFDIVKERMGNREWAMGRKGKVALGVVQGDIHDIGKNIVRVLVQASGFEVVDLGRNAPDSAFVRAAEDGCRIVGLSSLMTTTMPRMAGVIAALDKAGLHKDTRVIVGGAPVNQAFADTIGADGYAPDAHSAVKLIEELAAGSTNPGR